MTATSVRNTFAIAIAIAIASLASVALAQDPCSCKEACQVLCKPTCVNLCYVTGGTSCPIATPSRSKFGWAWIPCPNRDGAPRAQSTCDPQYEEGTEKDCNKTGQDRFLFWTETCTTRTYPKCVKDCDY